MQIKPIDITEQITTTVYTKGLQVTLTMPEARLLRTILSSVAVTESRPDPTLELYKALREHTKLDHCGWSTAGTIRLTQLVG
jgi:hypothetical protein